MQSVQTDETQQTVPENGTTPPNGDIETNFEQTKQDAQTPDNNLPLKTEAENATITVASATQQLKTAASEFNSGNFSEAYAGAMQVWQASQNGNATSAEWGELRKQAEGVMRDIDAQVPSSNDDVKPLVIRGK